MESVNSFIRLFRARDVVRTGGPMALNDRPPEILNTNDVVLRLEILLDSLDPERACRILAVNQLNTMLSQCRLYCLEF